MAAEIRTVAMAENDLVRSDTSGSEYTRERCCYDQSKWIMRLAEVGQIREQTNNTEVLVDSGACHVSPCKAKPAAGAPVESQGTLEVKFQLVDVHGVRIFVKAMFELLPVRLPILSDSRLLDKVFAVVMG